VFETDLAFVIVCCLHFPKRSFVSLFCVEVERFCVSMSSRISGVIHICHAFLIHCKKLITLFSSD
jgi:hypothetical protein